MSTPWHVMIGLGALIVTAAIIGIILTPKDAHGIVFLTVEAMASVSASLPTPAANATLL